MPSGSCVCTALPCSHLHTLCPCRNIKTSMLCRQHRPVNQATDSPCAQTKIVCCTQLGICTAKALWAHTTLVRCTKPGICTATALWQMPTALPHTILAKQSLPIKLQSEPYTQPTSGRYTELYSKPTTADADHTLPCYTPTHVHTCAANQQCNPYKHSNVLQTLDRAEVLPQACSTDEQQLPNLRSCPMHPHNLLQKTLSVQHTCINHQQVLAAPPMSNSSAHRLWQRSRAIMLLQGYLAGTEAPT